MQQPQVYELSMNYFGTDYRVQVDSLEVAHALLNGCKDKVHPKKLESSLPSTSTSDSPEASPKRTETDTPTSSKDSLSVSQNTKRGQEECDEPENRFKSRNKRIRPLSQTETVMKELQVERKQRQQEFEFMKKYLEESKKQKDDFLDIMRQLLLEKNS